jgi:hypothetical protein
MPTLEISDNSPTSILSAVTTFISSGGKLGTLLSSFIFGIGASIFIGVGRVVNAVVTFVTTPFIAGGEAVAALIGGILTSPVRILEQTAQESARAISVQFGWLAFLVGVGVVLTALYAVTRYLEEEETGDTFPGLPFDTPDLGPFEIGVTEEGEEDQGD